jgi:hypothetical protein
MTWFEDPPATHVHRSAKAPVSFKRRLGGGPTGRLSEHFLGEGNAIDANGGVRELDHSAHLLGAFATEAASLTCAAVVHRA